MMLAEFEVERCERRLCELQVKLRGRAITPRDFGRVLRAFIRYVPVYYHAKHGQGSSAALEALEEDRTLPISSIIIYRTFVDTKVSAAGKP